jgi:pyruvate formate lyase activating enzyme
MMSKKISKRDFLRYSVFGLGAAVASTDNARALAKGMISANLNTSSNPSEESEKFTHESSYYIKTARGVKCQICPNNCVLKEGQESLCRTHVVKDGKLYSMAYGNPCSVHIDPIEKKPLFHFLPTTKSYSISTAGCTFACLNCQNWEISQKSPKNTANVELMPSKVMQEAVLNGCSSVAYTYAEPIAFYEYMFESAKFVRARGLKNLLISNGFINEKPLRDLCKYMDAANINLKSFSDDIYEKLNGGSLQPVLNTLKILKEEGVWLEITNLVVPGWTDKPDMITQMCDWLAKNGFQDTPLHFSRFFPLYKLKDLPYTPMEILDKSLEIAGRAGLKYVYLGNVPGSPAESTYCPKCKKVMVERKGFNILNNYLHNSHCKFCGEKIAGVWS